MGVVVDWSGDGYFVSVLLELADEFESVLIEGEDVCADYEDVWFWHIRLRGRCRGIGVERLRWAC